MKLLYFCNMVPKMGSLEQQLAAIARQLRDDGDHCVEFVFGGPVPETISTLLAGSGAQWSVLEGWTDEHGTVHPWRFVAGALQRIRATRPDVAVVHFGNEWPAVIASIRSSMMGFGEGMRWVWVQDQRICDPSRLAALCSRIRLVGLFFDAVVAVSEAGARSLQLRGVPKRKVWTIHNSVSAHASEKPQGWLGREAGLPANAIVATCVSSLIPRKRVDKAIRAVRQATQHPALSTQHSALHLLIIGDGPERPRLESLAQELGLVDRIRFLGKRDDVRDILAQSDFLVHAAIAEGCAYAILESMAAGIPAVVTDSGAAREQIEDGVSGFVVDSEDEHQFELAVTLLAGDSGLRTRMGTAARERWHRRFHTDQSAKAYGALFLKR